MSSILKVIKVTKNVADVFWGTDGWEPRTRVHIAFEGTKPIVSYMAGTKMPSLIKAMLLKSLAIPVLRK